MSELELIGRALELIPFRLPLCIPLLGFKPSLLLFQLPLLFPELLGLTLLLPYLLLLLFHLPLLLLLAKLRSAIAIGLGRGWKECSEQEGNENDVLHFCDRNGCVVRPASALAGAESQQNNTLSRAAFNPGLNAAVGESVDQEVPQIAARRARLAV